MKRLVKLLSAAAAILFCVWLGRQLIDYIAPFLLSFAAAAIMEPAVSRLERHRVRRSLGAGLLTVILLILAGGSLIACGALGTQALTAYALRSPDLLNTLTAALGTVKLRFSRIIDAAPAPVETALLSAADSLSSELSRLPLLLSQKALDGVTVFARHSPDWLLTFCTAIIGIYFFSAYFRDIQEFFLRQLSPTVQQRLQLIRSVVTDAAAGYLKVQCIISGITFLILLAAFSLMQIRERFWCAAIIAVVDALPILGSGAVLLPWALVCFLNGTAARGVWLLIVYGVLLISHNLLQAKLMGSHLGLHPVTALVSLYAGWRLWGLMGMIALPVLCVLLCSLNRTGIIRLYQ